MLIAEHPLVKAQESRYHLPSDAAHAAILATESGEQAVALSLCNSIITNIFYHIVALLSSPIQIKKPPRGFLSLWQPGYGANDLRCFLHGFVNGHPAGDGILAHSPQLL
jgi:hypothetical protein